MNRTAAPHDYEVLVIGSGFGGRGRPAAYREGPPGRRSTDRPDLDSVSIECGAVAWQNEPQRRGCPCTRSGTRYGDFSQSARIPCAYP